MREVRSRIRRTLAGPTKRAWRSARKVLPDAIAEPLRVFTRRGLSAVGLLGGPPASPEAKVPQGADVADPDRTPAVTRTDPAECPVCGTVADGFLPFGMTRVKPERRCPTCGSLERHRAVWLFFQQRTNLFSEPVRMLHIAPEAFLQDRLSTFENIDYLSADLSSATAMVKMDITDIQYADDSFDVIFVSHVLEHIPDDERAMRELGRVLRPGGWAVLQVPIWGKATREDPAVVDPKERERLFGQSDHVRMYGHDGEYERRLRRSGFDVLIDRFVAEMDPAQAHRFRLVDLEDIYFCTKANAPGPEGSPC